VADDPILVGIEGGVARITLNRPGQGNAIDMALARALDAALKQCAEDQAIRCVVLTGAGRMFCAGGDIAGFAAAGDNASAFIGKLAAAFHLALLRIARLEKPVVALVNGPAAGAGLSIAIAADVVLAARGAHFTAAYGMIGLTPDGGMSWHLPRLVGLRKAQAIILSNERISAPEAERIGLITRAVDDTVLEHEGMALAQSLSRRAIAAWGGARALLTQSFDSDLETQLHREAETIARAAGGAEAREGIAAFLAKRKPDFGGT
jgi:2-(1,2-epoxy-1,2-dihydrophenyl)acetyl-CoA isomerase